MNPRIGISPCVTCHINPRITDRLRFSFGLIPKAYQVLTQNYILPLHTGNSVRNDACLQCHTPNRTVTPRNDLIVPHDQHYLNGVYCVDCHKGVTHGQIDERNQTIDGDFQKWTSEFAKQEMASGNLRIGMRECMECHQTKEIGPSNVLGVMKR
ncbi:cytochrome c3 family protein [Desulfitobacterium sp.]|uniref:cytochrome c3 family protein n=1 Tax=Desulfitobacterium sp. TaxID=49981 RepID=UPI002CB3E31C|nr:cytochrome c3 family protein [Desulfitobacterium sp.]HVJ48053.1 cytochrome c3 family protein [Desulfitobacterium sp.]